MHLYHSFRTRRNRRRFTTPTSTISDHASVYRQRIIVITGAQSLNAASSGLLPQPSRRREYTHHYVAENDVCYTYSYTPWRLQPVYVAGTMKNLMKRRCRKGYRYLLPPAGERSRGFRASVSPSTFRRRERD